MAENASLQNNLSQLYANQGLMDSPFPNMSFGQDGGAPPMPQNTLGMAQQGNMDFSGVAKKYGFDIQDLSPNQNIGQVQLMKRLQQHFGDDYMNNPGTKDIMQAYSSQPKQPGQEQDYMAQVTSGKRTLGALMGP